ncbi:inactive peptidyl-prolyl cis-trans isomerase FKBP6-like isoform X2 [Xenia sp. Carnegie-2017]|uniref:inactive peptidyl-prolyl cis-trans isomerase FKBP6-like isoform X2 n=1 Tax=Xenia sp. Carnegie-2017 TaxID=2897299 RepID=UPI001F04FAB8|nr:inactive peptidyl-prolyl cis-trans isomerase FKBP6-like isoform X2 [Xenia sp. Carnegie-2017]
MDLIDSAEEDFSRRSMIYNTIHRPNVILKDGFEPSHLLGQGIDIEIKENYREDSEDEDESAKFFDGEEMLSVVDYECIDGTSSSNTNSDKSPFELIKEKMTKITNDDGVWKMLVKNGTGPMVPDGAICRLHYSGYLEYRDEPFDSTRLRNKQDQLKLGMGESLRGFDVAVATMKKGEISKFLFSPSYAYKKMGCPPRVPPDATVLFQIELVSFIDQGASDEFSEFSMDEQKKATFENIYEVAQSFRQSGNDLFKRNEFYTAVKKYDKGIRILEGSRLRNSSEEKQMNDLLLLLFMNAALCSLKLGQGNRTKKYCRKALEFDPKNIKAMFRLAQGYQKEGEFEKAREWFLRSQKQEPNNSEIRAALQKLDQDVKRWRLSEKKMCQKMFVKKGQDSSVDETVTKKTEDRNLSDINEEVKAFMLQRLKGFNNDENQRELVFPPSLTVNEVNFLVEEAKAMDLKCITPTKKMNHLKIEKLE